MFDEELPTPSLDEIKSWNEHRVFEHFGHPALRLKPDHVAIFRDQETDGTTLILLTENDLLGPPYNLRFGPAKKIVHEIARLKDNSIGDEGAGALAESLKPNITLTELKLECNGVGNDGVRVVAESVKQNTTLTELNLSFNSTGDKGALALAKSLKRNMTLTKLYPRDNSIGDEGAPALAETLKQNTSLIELNLESNGIADDGVRAVAESLKQNTTLTKLNLSFNSTGDKGALALAKSPKRNMALTKLYPRDNSIDVEGKQNTALTELNLENNRMGHELVESLRQTTTLTELNHHSSDNNVNVRNPFEGCLGIQGVPNAIRLPRHPNVPLEEHVQDYCNILQANNSHDSTNLGTLFRPTIDTLAPLERQLLYMCSLFTGPITQGVLEFLRHFVDCVDISQNGFDSSETIALNLRQLYGRGLLAKQDEEYAIQFPLREGARLCNSILKFRLHLPIPGLLNDTFVIGVVRPSPHVKSMPLKWQLRRIQANAHRELKTRGFGIHYYSIGNEGLRIFKINGTVGDSIDNDSLAKVAPQQDASYSRLTVFTYNTSQSSHDSLGQFCNEQIIPLVQEKQMTFILCLNHTDGKFVERSRDASVLMKQAAEILQTKLEKTHWIIRTEAPRGIAQPNVKSASNGKINLDNKTVETFYSKRNNNVRMEGSFIGRANDLETLGELLKGPERYIKGFGGMSKASLTLQAFGSFNSIDDQSGMELSRITDGHPLSLRLLGGMFDNSKEPIEQFVDKVRKRIRVAVNEEFINERSQTINACIMYSFDYLDDVLQKFLDLLREWVVPFTSTLVIRALNNDPATSPVATNLHKLWQRSWLIRQNYEVDPMLGDWRPTIIKNETEFYSLHPRLHDFLNHRFDNVEATLPNDAEIQYYTALCYGVGFGVANDLAKQIEWCTKAASNGHSEAQFALAACYQGGCGVSRDPKKAFDLCLKAAKAGSKQAQSEIVWYYRQGYGVVKDEVKATFWEKVVVGNNKALSFDLSLPLIHRAAKDGDVAMVRSLCANVSDVSVRDRLGRTPLHVAAHTGHIDLIDELLYECNADRIRKDLYGNTPLHLAAQNGHPEATWLLVTACGVDPNFKDYSGKTPLHKAAIEGHLDVVKVLLADSKADRNAKANDGWTPLHWASNKGHVEVVKVLLADSKADANAKTNKGWTPLHWASNKGHVEVVKVLLADSKADVNARQKAEWTPLHFAAQNGHIEVVKVLLADSKANANAKQKEQWTPLHYAAQNGHVEVVKVLLADSKADANASEEDNWKPLHLAAQNGHVQVVKVLLADSKADANAKTNVEATPLHYAAQNGHLEVAKLLLADFKADANARQNEGATPLYIAAEKGHIEVIKLLVAGFGADANAIRNGGFTPLHMAAYNGHIEAVRLLVAMFGADVNAKKSDGRMPLHQAALNGHVEVVRLLVAEFGADANAREENDWTPLHIGAQNGHVEVVRLLLAEFGADPNAKNNQGLTALNFAEHNGHVKVVKLLVAETREA